MANGNPHVSFVTKNVRVFFPFEPYDTQRDYVESVITALTSGKHALLESPTGTGKTLSLLCSSLAWLQSSNSKSMIYYTSRTHMQLAQAAKEMKRTAYAKIPSVVIGSRSQMCLNDEVKQSGEQFINRSCRNAIAKNACTYYSNYEQKLEVMNHESVHDIEDLAKFGKSHQCCPYYASKKLAEVKASLVFMPYNYLLDSSMRKSTNLKLEKSVIIFDEAHNIEGVLKDAVSGSFTQTCLKTIQESCLKLPQKIHEALNKEKHGLSRYGYEPKEKQNGVVNEFAKKSSSSKPNQEVKVNPIEELANKLSNDKLQQVNKCAELLQEAAHDHLKLDDNNSIDKIFYIMKQSGISYPTSSDIITTLDSMASFWSIAGVMDPKLVARFVSAITNLSHVISLLYPDQCLSGLRQKEHEKTVAMFYTSYYEGIFDSSVVLRKGPLKDWKLNIWCLHSAIGMKKAIDSNCVNGPRSMIFTSGTLAPLRPMAKELGLEIGIMKEFKHVIGENQLKILLLKESPNRYSLESHHKAILKDQYSIELGKTLSLLYKVLPFGTLTFFPSYNVMNTVTQVWKNKSNLWRDIAAISPIYVEDKKKDAFLNAMLSYKKDIDSSPANGRAIYLGVCRGKLSEGVNLEGNHCRTVILTGLPFPNLNDPKVIATREFHECSESRGGLNNHHWYSQQMTRALNQTIGRVIRSKNDFGMLLLCDPRFQEYKFSLSEWTRPFFPAKPTRWNAVDSEVKEFFRTHGISIAASATESFGAFEIGFNQRPTAVGSLMEEVSTFSEGINGKNTQSSRVSLTDNRFHTLQAEDARLEPRTAQERQAAMVAGYVVDRVTYDKLKSKRSEQSGEKVCGQHLTTKRLKTVDLMQSIYDQEGQISHSDAPVSSSTQLDHNMPNGQDGLTNETVGTNRQQSSHQGEPTQHYVPKSKKSLNIFKMKTKKPKPRAGPSQTQLTGSSQLSVMDQFSDPNRPSSYVCWICEKPAQNPVRTNCPCTKVGCKECVRKHNGQVHGKCGVQWKKRDFKEMHFKSAFFQHERQSMITAPKRSKFSKRRGSRTCELLTSDRDRATLSDSDSTRRPEQRASPTQNIT